LNNEKLIRYDLKIFLVAGQQPKNYITLAAIAVIFLILGYALALLVTPKPSVTTPQGPVTYNLPLNEKTVYAYNWSQIESLAKQEGKVVFAIFGGTHEQDVFNHVCQNFQAKYGIQCQVVLGDWYSTVQSLIADKQAGKTVGQYDVVFLWSLPFKMAKENGVVWDVNLREIIPNAKKVPLLANMFGTDMYPTDGRYIPIVWWQVVMLYRKDILGQWPNADVPKSLDQLLDWVKKHPGKFTYCDPNKGGSGHTFLMALLYSQYGYDKFSFAGYSEQRAHDIMYSPGKSGMNFWDYLNEIEKYMYQPGNYPQGNVAAIQLFEAGEVLLEPQWIDTVLAEINEGRLKPEWVGMYIPDPGMPEPWDGVIVAFNAPHKAAALLFINYLLEDETQAYIAANEGTFPVVPNAWNLVPADVKANPAWPVNIPYGSFEKWFFYGPFYFRHAEYMNYMMQKWVDEVAKK
jgi:putative spermidine/putrescine transport system substrate-binding protein